MKIDITQHNYHFYIPNFSYDTAQILHECQLTLSKHNWTGLIGKSGCGKSTLLKLMIGLIGPPIHTNIKTTYLSQEDSLLPWANVIDNILLPQKFTPYPDYQKAHKLIEKIGLLNVKDKLPRTLSVGMKQRVTLARALMTDADLILMDEPFSALDCFTRHEMHQLALDCLQDKTVLLVTHDPHEASLLCKNHYIMQEGFLKPYIISPPETNLTQKVMEDLCA